MTWTIPIIVSALSLGAGLWFWRRRRSSRTWSQAGIVELKGRICGARDEQEARRDDSPLSELPAVISLCSGGQCQELHLDNPHLDRGWSRAPLRPGDRVKVDAMWVDRGSQPPSYRETGGGPALEALSVQLCRGVLARRAALSAVGAMVLALVSTLVPTHGNKENKEDQLATIIDQLQCPAESRLQRVNLDLQGRLGFCLQRESGLRHGPWLHLSIRGVKLVEGYYELGQKHRLWTVRSEAGQALARGRYNHDQQEGRWRYWDSTGHEIRSAKFVHGWPEAAPTSRL